MPAANFHTDYANNMLQNLIFNSVSWSYSPANGSPLTINTFMKGILFNTDNNPFTTFTTSDTKRLAECPDTALVWGGAENGGKSLTATFTTVSNAGVPYEFAFCFDGGGGSQRFPVCLGAVTASAAGGMVIGDTSSYSTGTRVYTATLYIPPNNGATLRLGLELRNAICNNMVVGGATLSLGTGTLSFYNGTQPASADDAVTTQTLLASVTISSAAWGTAASRQISNSSVITTGTAAASGTATWARLVKNTYVMDFGVGAISGDIIVPNAFVSGNTNSVPINGITISWPV